MTKPTLFPGEAAAIRAVLDAGSKYGYGNMIGHLRREWAELLRDVWGISDTGAIEATNADAYPLRIKGEKLV